MKFDLLDAIVATRWPSITMTRKKKSVVYSKSLTQEKMCSSKFDWRNRRVEQNKLLHTMNAYSYATTIDEKILCFVYNNMSMNDEIVKFKLNKHLLKRKSK